ncbi:Hypothetical protein D9617_31g063530 [Elsinoe fawcettii]|nr:Hypothetical protein D9617_31g063530 [Elsinoe fawcettii]
MPSTADPYLTQSDLIVLENLFRDNQSRQSKDTSRTSSRDTTPDITTESKGVDFNDAAELARLRALNDSTSPDFQPTVFVTWDEKDIPAWLNQYLVRPYANIAKGIVRHPTDVVFLTHIILYLTVNLPSAVYLYFHFNYIHAIAHGLLTGWCAGSFTLLLHNHIHNGGVLKKEWYWLDVAFPYLLEPLMGHTWDSYFYHHVKHHHVEGNGPNDLSSTIRYQRDELVDFLQYVGRFLFLVWWDLPMYFFRNKKTNLAIRSGVSELTSYAFLYYMFIHVNARATTFTLIIPFMVLRIALMVGNWGQHALVDEVEPDSDFRSSITLIDVPSNRFCFNDGYHTAHHLNPRRHWREHPVHFLQSKEAYSSGRALVFHNIDYIMMTVKLLQKDYAHLAKCLVPIGDQVNMSKEEIADMLRTKTRKFSEAEISKKFKKG